MSRKSLFLALMVMGLTPVVSWAQIPRFYYPTMTMYEPEIDVVNSGILSDMQAWVGPDRRYVTINARPSQSQLLAMRTFAFGQGNAVTGAGFVGGVSFGAQSGPVRPTPRDHRVTGAAPVAAPVMPVNCILNRPGMTRLNSASK